MLAGKDEVTTTKPDPHEAAESGRMPAEEDEVTMTKPAPHEAAESGRMPADKDEVTTTKPAPHDAAASGRMPDNKDEATRNKPGAVGEDKEEPLAVKQSKKMPKRSKCFRRVLQGKGSCNKRQRTNHYLDVNLDMSAPIPIQLVPFHFPHQDPTVRENDDTHVPSQVDDITQLRRKVRNSALRNEKLTQLVAQLKSEVCDLKRHAKESDADHTKVVADLKDKYCELLREKHRDKKSVNNVSVCHQFIFHCLNRRCLTLSCCFIVFRFCQ